MRFAFGIIPKNLTRKPVKTRFLKEVAYNQTPYYSKERKKRMSQN